MEPGKLRLRTFRQVWRQEKVIYQIERVRLPFPVTLRQVAIFVAALLALVPLRRLPLLAGIPPLAYYGLLPGLAAWYLTRQSLDGRSPHRWLLAMVQFALGPRRLARLRPLARGGRAAFVRRRWGVRTVPFPYVHLEKNLVITREGDVWALYQLEPWHYEHLGPEARLGLLWRLSRLFWELEDHAGQLLIVPHTQRVAEHLEELAGQLDGPLAPAGRAICRQAAAAIRRAYGPEAHDYAYFLALRLPRRGAADQGAWGFFRTLLAEVRRAVEELAGVAEPRLSPRELEEWLAREALLFQRLGRIVRAVRLAEEHTAWLIRRAFYRGIGDPPGRPGWRPGALAVEATGRPPALVPAVGELRTLAEGELDLSNPRLVGVTQVEGGGERTGYTSFLYIADLPDEMAFPGCEWVYSLQDLRFPVEVCLRWETLRFRDALAQVRHKQLELADQDAHIQRSGEAVPIGLREAREEAALLEEDLKQRRTPILLATVCLAVSGTSPEQVWQRVRRLRDHLLAFQITAEVPAGDQFRAFLECLPGTRRQMADYEQRLPPEVLAASMFLAAPGLGDPVGPYIGRTGPLGRPVYLDPTLPPRLDRPASMAFVGSPGSGKSFASNLLTYLAVVTRGARALVLDPKGERGRWPELLPELGDQVRVITLGPRPADRGKLDPFVVGRGLGRQASAETADLAASLLSFLAGARMGEGRFLRILQAVEQAAAGPRPSLTAVVEALAAMGQHDPEAAALAEYFGALSRRAYAGLLFGTGDEEGPDLGCALTVLQIQDLTLPPPGRPRADYSLEELLSVGLLHGVTAFATCFAASRPEVFKVVLLDEAWMLTGSPQGRALVARLLRMGRSYNAGLYLVTQNVADLLDETIRNNLGAKLVFRATDEGEVARSLSLLGLEPTPENLAAVRGLETGQALLQDQAGRTGMVTIDPVLPHLARAFDTRPPVPAEVP